MSSPTIWRPAGTKRYPWRWNVTGMTTASNRLPSGNVSRRPSYATFIAHAFVRKLWPFRVKLCRKTATLPVTDIGFGKVSKQWLCLDTFSIHSCAVVTFHEPVPRIIEWLGKVVQEPICGSRRLMSDHRKRPKPYTLNHWVVGSIPTRCNRQQRNSGK